MTIGVIGANGQVGSEVCLFLSCMDSVRVVPICRNVLGSAFLRQCGLECRHGTMDSPEQAAQLTADCDLVADFSLPRALASEARQTIRRIITNALQGAPLHARFVYISSIMAFGMGNDSKSFRQSILAHSMYGATKRYAERLAFRLGKKLGREVYVLRLGQVHGELQGVSRLLRQAVRDLRGESVLVPDVPSYTVFTFTIAEALVNIASGKEEPGLYTLVSVPEWSWKEIYEFYARREGVEARIAASPDEHKAKPAWLNGIATFIKRFTVTPLLTAAVRHRELIGGSLLVAFPRLERRLAAKFLCHRAAAEVEEGKNEGHYRPFDKIYWGNIPGRRLRTLSDSRTSMEPLAYKVRQLLNRVAKMCEAQPLARCMMHDA